MNRIERLRKFHDKELETYCLKNRVSFRSIQNLLEVEKVRKLTKRSASMQQIIDKEINNNLENEN